MTTNMLELDDVDVPKLLDRPRWDVNLHMQFDEADAATPLAAVSQFLVAILYEGMSGMTFTVRDLTSDATVVVEGGTVRAGGARHEVRS